MVNKIFNSLFFLCCGDSRLFFYWMWSLTLHKNVNKFTYADTISYVSLAWFFMQKKYDFSVGLTRFWYIWIWWLSHWVNNSSITFDLLRFACTANRFSSDFCCCSISRFYTQEVCCIEWLLRNFSLLTISFQNLILLYVCEREISQFRIIHNLLPYIWEFIRRKRKRKNIFKKTQ